LANRTRIAKTRKQGGLTLIGFIIVLSIALFASFIGMKIGPIYLDNFAVIRAMNEIAGEPGISKKSPQYIRYKFSTLMNINAVDHVKQSHVKLTRDNGLNLRVAYEVREPIMGNLDVVVTFNKSVRLN